MMVVVAAVMSVRWWRRRGRWFSSQKRQQLLTSNVTAPFASDPVAQLLIASLVAHSDGQVIGSPHAITGFLIQLGHVSSCRLKWSPIAGTRLRIELPVLVQLCNKFGRVQEIRPNIFHTLLFLSLQQSLGQLGIRVQIVYTLLLVTRQPRLVTIVAVLHDFSTIFETPLAFFSFCSKINTKISNFSATQCLFQVSNLIPYSLVDSVQNGRLSSRFRTTFQKQKKQFGAANY